MIAENTLRAILREAVSEFVPVDRREAYARTEVVNCLDRLEHPFSRHHDPVHVTGSGIVVGPRGVLLHKHRKLGIWVQPGGHLEPGESSWDAARRETAEETGIAVGFAPVSQVRVGPAEWVAAAGEIGTADLVGALVGTTDPPPLLHVDIHPAGEHTHLDMRYLLVVAGRDDTPAPPPGESQDVRWFDWAEARRIADPGLAGLLSNIGPGRREWRNEAQELHKPTRPRRLALASDVRKGGR